MVEIDIQKSKRKMVMGVARIAGEVEYGIKTSSERQKKNLETAIDLGGTFIDFVDSIRFKTLEKLEIDNYDRACFAQLCGGFKEAQLSQSRPEIRRHKLLREIILSIDLFNKVDLKMNPQEQLIEVLALAIGRKLPLSRRENEACLSTHLNINNSFPYFMQITGRQYDDGENYKFVHFGFLILPNLPVPDVKIDDPGGYIRAFKSCGSDITAREHGENIVIYTEERHDFKIYSRNLTFRHLGELEFFGKPGQIFGVNFGRQDRIMIQNAHEAVSQFASQASFAKVSSL